MLPESADNVHLFDVARGTGHTKSFMACLPMWLMRWMSSWRRKTARRTETMIDVAIRVGACKECACCKERLACS